MNEAFHLSRLQKMDTQLDQTAARLAEIARLLSSDETVRATENQAAETGQALEAARRALRKTEEAVQSQRIKIELNDTALYGGKVRNPKELQDMQNEAAALRRHLATLEDQQLEAMLALEECEQAYATANDHLNQAQGQYAGQAAVLRGEQSRLEKDAGRLTAERSALTAQVAASALDQYERLRKQKRGLAVAGIEEGACTACGSELTPADWQAARNPNAIVTCSSCGRIVYAG